MRVCSMEGIYVGTGVMGSDVDKIQNTGKRLKVKKSRGTGRKGRSEISIGRKRRRARERKTI